MQRYRLRTTTVAVQQEHTRPVATSIPSGTILNVADDPPNVGGFVEVEWGGNSLQIFAVDLRDRAELIMPTSTAR
jgi:hypothetical protein